MNDDRLENLCGNIWFAGIKKLVESLKVGFLIMLESDLMKQMCKIIDIHGGGLIQLVDDNESIAQVLLSSLKLMVRWDIRPDSDLTKGNVIFSFSFGIGKNKSPGKTNMALAMSVNRLFAKYHVPVFTQWEIADALLDLGLRVDFKASLKDTYLSTRGVLNQFCQEIHRRGMPIIDTNVILVAHPEHRYRCAKLIEETGFSVMIPDDNHVLEKYWEQCGCDKYGYDPESEQEWTRSREAFILHELAVRMALLRDGVNLTI
ncbi:MAG: hypothetical protein GY796_12110 [Chloroflexi bacterium]|nr:hypothetical protein [Chloroflexota bacterium]